MPWAAWNRARFRNLPHAVSQWSAFIGADVERAPSMQPELLPTLLDHEWAVFIHSYFGAKPYWEPNSQHA